MYIVCRFPEPDSPLAHALTEGDYWTTTQALMALLNDRMAMLMWGLGGSKGQAPKRLLGEQETTAKTYVGDLMTFEEADAFAASQRGISA